jgi:hypothetical protein
MPDLIDRAKQGLLSRDELDAIADRLEHQDTFEHVGDQLMVMQFAGDGRYRRAVERYLDLREDLGAVSRALQVLCFNWDLTAEYFGWLVHFVEGVPWDLRLGTQHVRSEALILAGSYLTTARSRPLLELLLRIAEDESEQPVIRGEAAATLIRAQSPWPHHAPLELSLDDPRFAQAIHEARERLRSEPDPPPAVGRRPVPPQALLPDYVESFLPAQALRSELVERARSGSVSADDADRLARELRGRPSDDRVGERLVALLYAGDARHRDAVEPYLAGGLDAETAGLALLVLCAGWRLTGDYLEQVASFIEQDRPQPRRLGFTIAGTYLATRRSRPLLELLLNIADDARRPPSIRAEALGALYRATDGFPGDVPVDLDERDVAHALREARARLPWG